MQEFAEPGYMLVQLAPHKIGAVESEAGGQGRGGQVAGFVRMSKHELAGLQGRPAPGFEDPLTANKWNATPLDRGLADAVPEAEVLDRHGDTLCVGEQGDVLTIDDDRAARRRQIDQDLLL